MKLHPPLVKAAMECLHNIFIEQQYADKVLERSFKSNKKWGKRDRHFIAEMVYYTVRWRDRLLYTLEQEELIRGAVAAMLQLAIFLKHEVVDTTLSKKTESSLQELSERYYGELPDAVRFSLPSWLYDHGLEQMTDKELWRSSLESMNDEAQVLLRANPIKTDRAKLLKELTAEGYEVEEIPELPFGIELKKRKNVFISESFQKGFFEVQDGSSQKVAPYLDPQPGEFVVDACAGAGGKTLHLAALMKNKGRLVAMDIHQWKLNELKKRARRAGLSNVEMKEITSNKVVKRLYGKVDRLLLDVPCSGVGVLKRNPDTKWKINSERLASLIKEQQEILSKYSAMVKKGGFMVYSTCSIFPDENERQVETFLRDSPDWDLVKQQTLYPSRDGFDGFFMALMKRNSDSPKSGSV